jgi:1-acyl-sn-glycerol-3-phosphate acyltransferase
MLDRCIAWLRATFSFALIAANTLSHAPPLLALAVLKLLVPWKRFRRSVSRGLVRIAESWIAINSALIGRVARTDVVVTGEVPDVHDAWYLVLCNHQSWVDIPILQKIFNRRIPLLRFFLKQQLIWVPVLGACWWALDFPFMQRYSRETLERHPHLRGKDVEATRVACEKFRELPVSIMNFVEGTRFRPEKHARQQSPYRHLLKPRAGGVAFVLDAMGTMMTAVIDVTLFYPDGRPGVVDLFSGRVRRIDADVRVLPIPQELLGGDYEGDADYRARFQEWINALWSQKDALLSRMASRTGA